MSGWSKAGWSVSCWSVDMKPDVMYVHIKDLKCGCNFGQVRFFHIHSVHYSTSCNRVEPKMKEIVKKYPPGIRHREDPSYCVLRQGRRTNVVFVSIIFILLTFLSFRKQFLSMENSLSNFMDDLNFHGSTIIDDPQYLQWRYHGHWPNPPLDDGTG